MRTGVFRLARRQFVADPWVTIFLAVLVALAACVATLWPRMVLDINSRQLDHVVSGLSTAQRGLTGAWSTTVLPDRTRTYDDLQETWGEAMEGMERARQTQPEPLRSLMQPGQFVGTLGAPFAIAPKEGTGLAAALMDFRIDPFLSEHVTLIEGEWPEVVLNPSGARVQKNEDGQPVDEQGNVIELSEPQRIPIALVEDAAEGMHWEVGEEMSGLVLSGIYRPDDPGAARWDIVPHSATMGTVYDGNVGTTAHLSGYLGAANPGSLGAPTSLSMTFWFPVDASGVDGDEVQLVRSQLVGMTSRDQVIQEGTGDLGATRQIAVQFHSDLVDTLREVVQQQQATSAILAVVAAGPMGVTLAVFVLGTRLIVQRRRPSLALVRARGGSGAQVRTVLAIEWMLVGLPAAAMGYVAAHQLLPVFTGWAEWVVAGLIGLVPAAALALRAGGSPLREERADLGVASCSRLRWIVEVVVLALAGLAVWRMLVRGLVGVATESAADGERNAIPASGASADITQVDRGVDLLIAATPVLLALAACVITLRVYPLPVRVLVHHFRGQRSLTSFLGAARAVRDPVAGVVPALAVVLGSSVALYSAVMAGTIMHGAEKAAWTQTGAAIKLSGPPVTDELREQILAVPGVEQVAVVDQVSNNASLAAGDKRNIVDVYAVDPDIALVQAASPLVEDLPDALFAGGGLQPVVVSGVDLDTDVVNLSGLGEVLVVSEIETLPGVGEGEYVVVDRTEWVAATGDDRPGNRALMSVEPGADRTEIAETIRNLGNRPFALVETPDTQLQRFRDAPVTSGLTWMVVAVVALTTLLTVLAVLLVQMIGAPARARLLAVLRTLGLEPRQSRALTAWELGPLLAVSLVVGTALGLGIPWLLLKAVDLKSMTGGFNQPSLYLDPVLLGSVALGVIGTVVLTVLVSAAVAVRANLAQQLQVGDE